MPIAKNTAHDVPFALVNASTGAALTGATVSGYRCLDGAVQAAVDGSFSQLGGGQYLFEGVAADFNADYTTGLLFTATNAVPVHVIFQMRYFASGNAYDIPFLLIDVRNSGGLIGASPSGLRCLDGGGQVAVTGTFAERGNGQYVFQASAADFGAEDIAGFLITATNAVPRHLIIDLLESYAATALLEDTPASVLATYITGKAVMIVPGGVGSWPLYVSFLPDSPDNAGAIYDTTPVQDFSLMDGGARVQHYGVQISIRATSQQVGYDKCQTIAGELDAIHNAAVTRAANSYTVHNVGMTGGINTLGLEPGTRRRYVFSMNFLVSIS